MAVDNYTTFGKLQDGGGNTSFDFNASTGEFDLNFENEGKEAHVPFHKINKIKTSDTGFYFNGLTNWNAGPDSNSPAHLVITRDRSGDSALGLDTKQSDPSVESGDYFEATVYVFNPFNSKFSISGSRFGDSLDLSSFDIGDVNTEFDSINIPPGGWVIIRRKENFQWQFVGGDIDLEEPDLPTNLPTISFNSNRFIQKDENLGSIEWLTTWEQGLVTSDGDAVEALKWDGTQTTFTQADSIAELFARRNITTTSKRLWQAESSYIWSMDLTSGNQSNIFTNGLRSDDLNGIFISNWSNAIVEDSIYAAGTTAPGSDGNLVVGKYSIDKFEAGNVNWDKDNLILLRSASLPLIETGSVDLYTHSGRLFAYVDIRESGFSDLIIEVDPETLEEVRRLEITLPEGEFVSGEQTGQLLSYLHRFGDLFYVIADSVETGEQYLLTISNDFRIQEASKIPDSPSADDASTDPPIFPATEGGLYIPVSRFIGDSTVIHHIYGVPTLKDGEDDLSFQTDINIRKDYVAYSPSGIWVRVVDDGNGNAGLAPLENEFIDYTQYQKHSNF